MRVPKQPPDYMEVLSSRAEEFMQSASTDKYRGAMSRVEEKYYPWDKVRFIAREEDVDPEFLWAMVKFSRTSRARQLPLLGHSGQPVTYSVPDIIHKELMHVDQQFAGQLGADDEQPLDAVSRERFIISALRDEAIASSMLEGAATTRQDAKRMLREARQPKTRGEQMVHNNYQAMMFVRDNKDVDLSAEMLIEIQKIVTDSTLDDPTEAGRLRTPSDKIRIVHRDDEVVHDPPPAQQLSRRLKVLCDFANRADGPFLHPVLHASALHFQIGFDHPFCDGNGRTARAVFYWFMLRAGYWLFEYLPISSYIYDGPTQYGMAFLNTEVDDFDLTYFLVYKIGILRRARLALHEHIKHKRQEIVLARTIYEKDTRLNHRQRPLVLRMTRNPDQVVTIAMHTGRHNVSYGTARSDLLDLAEWGYLKKHLLGNLSLIHI